MSDTSQNPQSSQTRPLFFIPFSFPAEIWRLLQQVQHLSQGENQTLYVYFPTSATQNTPTPPSTPNNNTPTTNTDNTDTATATPTTNTDSTDTTTSPTTPTSNISNTDTNSTIPSQNEQPRDPFNFVSFPFPIIFQIHVNSENANQSNIHLQGQPPASLKAISKLSHPDITSFSSKNDICAICQEPLSFILPVSEQTIKQPHQNINSITYPMEQASNDMDSIMIDSDHNISSELVPSSSFSTSTFSPSPSLPPAKSTSSSDLLTPSLPLLSQFPCSHTFHATCLNTWLAQSNTCPTCRWEIETDNEQYNEGVKNRMQFRQARICALASIQCCSGEGDILKRLSGCHCYFHQECLEKGLRINGWSETEGRCPMCRKPGTVISPSSSPLGTLSID